jgi:hypothetical protein
MYSSPRGLTWSRSRRSLLWNSKRSCLQVRVQADKSAVVPHRMRKAACRRDPGIVSDKGILLSGEYQCGRTRALGAKVVPLSLEKVA